MNKHNILFIGLDTHKEFNEVAYFALEPEGLFVALASIKINSLP